MEYSVTNPQSRSAPALPPSLPAPAGRERTAPRVGPAAPNATTTKPSALRRSTWLCSMTQFRLRWNSRSGRDGGDPFSASA